MMEHYHDKGLLGWFDGGMAPPHLESSSNNGLGLNNGTSGNLPQAPKNLELGLGYFVGASHSHNNYFFRYNHSYFIQVCAPLLFVSCRELAV